MLTGGLCGRHTDDWSSFAPVPSVVRYLDLCHVFAFERDITTRTPTYSRDETRVYYDVHKATAISEHNIASLDAHSCLWARNEVRRPVARQRFHLPYKLKMNGPQQPQPEPRQVASRPCRLTCQTSLSISLRINLLLQSLADLLCGFNSMCRRIFSAPRDEPNRPCHHADATG